MILYLIFIRILCIIGYDSVTKRCDFVVPTMNIKLRPGFQQSRDKRRCVFSNSKPDKTCGAWEDLWDNRQPAGPTIYNGWPEGWGQGVVAQAWVGPCSSVNFRRLRWWCRSLKRVKKSWTLSPWLLILSRRSRFQRHSLFSIAWPHGSSVILTYGTTRENWIVKN